MLQTSLKQNHAQGGNGLKTRRLAQVALRAVTHLFKAQAFVWQGVTGDWRGDDPRTISQWVLLIGASWSMLVIITFYTAQVAASIILGARTDQIRSFEQVRGPANSCHG